jgi:hypothetical protein
MDEPSERILREGTLCHVCAETPRGPHLTPLVFAWVGERLWLTTARGSVKARAWSVNNTVSGMVRHDAYALCFKGVVRTYDLLDPSSWVGAAVYAPALARATGEFTRKNARFFAGYAVDARKVPLAWTPPGRVFVEVQVKSSVVYDLATGERSGSAWAWEPRIGSAGAFPSAPDDGIPALDGVPDDVVEEVSSRGNEGALAVEASFGTLVVPALWAHEGSELYAAVDPALLSLASSDEPSTRVALTVDHEAEWRASAMAGFMARGTADVFVRDRLKTGKRAMSAMLAKIGAGPSDALVRIRPGSVVWWKGWASGTLRR